MWNRLAMTKCPVSCSMTDTSRATTKITTPSRKLIRLDLLQGSLHCAPSCRRARQLPRADPGPLVRSQDLRHFGHRRAAAVMLRDYLGYGIDDSGVGDTSRHERGHAYLVGSVVNGRDGPAGPARLAGQGDRREGVGVQRLECPGMSQRPVDRGGGPGHPLRPAEGERDGNPHVRGAWEGEGGA